MESRRCPDVAWLSRPISDTVIFSHVLYQLSYLGTVSRRGIVPPGRGSVKGRGAGNGRPGARCGRARGRGPRGPARRPAPTVPPEPAPGAQTTRPTISVMSSCWGASPTNASSAARTSAVTSATGRPARAVASSARRSSPNWSPSARWASVTPSV